MKSHHFYRSTDDAFITGLLGGLGAYFGVNPFAFRLAFLLIAVYTAFFPIFLPYVIVSFLTKKQPFLLEQPSYMPLYRSRSNRRVAGVIGGLAEAYEVDPTVLRILFLIFAVCTVFPFTLTYLFSWMLLPVEH
ncbi:MAG: PspC domain-containing protein [Chlamydiota bacterium]